MKHWKSAVLFSFAALFFFGCFSPRVQAPTLHQRPTGFWENKKAVVQVYHFYYVTPADADGVPIFDANGQFRVYQIGELGTGGVLDVNGLEITNNHVVTASPKEGWLIVKSPLLPDIYMVCTVEDGFRACEPGEVEYTDQEHDLALVYTDQHFPRAIEFADEELKPGDEIYLWGNVGELLPPSPFFGHYSGLLGLPYFVRPDFIKTLPLLMMDINVSWGSSGSPVFNEEGKCIGIAVAAIPASDLGSRSLPFIIPLSTVRESLTHWTDIH